MSDRYVLRTVEPGRLEHVLPPVQSAVAASLDWFVVQAPTLASSFCAEQLPGVAIEALGETPSVTVERAQRGSGFRRHVSVLSRATEVFEVHARAAFNARPIADRQARGHINGPHDPLLVTDYVYARAWLKLHGTNAGYWAYRYTRSALQLAAVTGAEHGAALTALLHESAERTLRAHLPPGTGLDARGARPCTSP